MKKAKIIGRRFVDNEVYLDVKVLFHIVSYGGFSPKIIDTIEHTTSFKVNTPKGLMFFKTVYTESLCNYTEIAKSLFPNAIITRVSTTPYDIKRDGRFYNVIGDIYVYIENELQYSRSKKINLIKEL
jgi:hypothetical protein